VELLHGVFSGTTELPRFEVLGRDSQATDPGDCRSTAGIVGGVPHRVLRAIRAHRGRKVPNAAHLTCLFFAGSVAWAFLARSALEGGGPVPVFLTIASLIVVAIANIMLLLASIKARNHTASIGMLLLAPTVVVADGILWNIMFARAMA